MLGPVLVMDEWTPPMTSPQEPRIRRPSLIICDVSAVADPDMATVDTLARLQLTARRSGTTVALTGLSKEFKELLELAGLASVFARCTSAVEPTRQPEEGEEPRGIQEEADPGDPSL